MLTSLARFFRGPYPVAAKVPEIGVLFWVIKVLTTGMGESLSDFLGSVSIPLAGAIGIVGFAFALRRQLRSPAYNAVTYWGCVMMVAVFGTMAADGVHDGTGMPYSLTTLFYALVVAAIFLAWHRSEGTLSIHSITTRRREGFYWSAVLATFALGTAAGDYTAIQLDLGFLGSVGFFAAVIAVPALLTLRGPLGPTAGFWAAYVVTRPLGASVADWLGKPVSQTGVGLGDGVVSAIAFVIFAGLVAYVATTKRDLQPHVPAHHPHLRLERVEAQGAEA